MNTRIVTGLLMSLVIGTTVLVGACERKGPAERAGKQFDRAIGDLKDAAKRATK